MPEKVSFPYWIGVDVSKDSFTAACRSVICMEETIFPPRPKYSMGKKDVKEFLQWARSVGLGKFEFGIAMESTGIYSRRLVDMIHEISPAQHVTVCNAASVSWFARGFTEEKNDKADAESIARYACNKSFRQERQKSKEEKRLQELVRERARLVDMRLQLKNRREALECADAIRLHDSLIRDMDKAIERLEAMITATVRESEEIKPEVRRMATMPGVGMLSAACYYGEYGSLKNYTRKEISALSGVCPVNKVSGTSVNRHGMSRRGPALVRKMLFLNSNQAIRAVPSLADFHQRMLEKPDSSKMTAKCACMRKILLILHAMVVNEKDFDPNYKSEKKGEKMEKSA